MSELYRDFIDGKADAIINSLGGTITPAPANAELYRDFLDRKFDDVINATNGLVKIKSFKYTGNGTNSANITFTTKPTIVLQIYGTVLGYANYSDMFTRDSVASCINIMNPATPTSYAFRAISLNWTSDTTLEITGENAQRSFNNNNSEYTVYYI